MATRRKLTDALGPGIMFAATAVGVSHLVQSTRAGAGYGLGLAAFVVLANVVKYPAFRFGPHYAAATGTSLLEGYRRQGLWAVWLYGLLTLATAATVLAVVTLVTAGLAIAMFGVPGGPVGVTAALLTINAILLAVGEFRLLDRVVKLLVAIFTACTLVATGLVLGHIDWPHAFVLPDLTSKKDVFFLAALFGWMPSAIDVGVWQSLWTLEREKDAHREVSLHDSMLDFHIGYVGTAALALCFVALGAGVMFGTGAELEDTAGGFAAQVVDMYGQMLGDSWQPVVGTAAFAVMFSTALTGLDGFSRGLEGFVLRLQGPESKVDVDSGQRTRPYYFASMVLLSLAAVAVLLALLESLKQLVDVATTLSFLTAPILSWLNHRSLMGDEVPAAGRPAPWLIIWSAASIAVQAAFALAYLYVRYAEQ